MRKPKRKILTPEYVKALLKSPCLVKKRKAAEVLFNSPQFKAHIKERSAKKVNASRKIHKELIWLLPS
jgi:hypothetical protein